MEDEEIFGKGGEAYNKMFKKFQEEIGNPEVPMECYDCGWKGNQSDLINSSGLGDDKYVEGEECPDCWSKNVGEIDE